MLTAPPTLDQAAAAVWAAEKAYFTTGAAALARDVLAAHPEARYVELGMNDQEGSTFYGSEITDANGDMLAPFDEFDDDHWAICTDLPDTPTEPLAGNEGWYRTALPFLTLHGSRRMGYTGRIDLQLAAAA